MKVADRVIKQNSRLVLFSGVLLAGLFSTVRIQAQESRAGKTVSQKKFQRLMNKKNTVLLDVRTADEYQAGHIPGALQIDVLITEDFKNQVATLDKGKRYLVYCRSGKRSKEAMELMKGSGFAKLYDLEGGFSKWTGEKDVK